MRSLLGRFVALSVIGGVTLIGASSARATPAVTTATTTTSTSTTTTTSTSTTTTSTSTSTTTTSTTTTSTTVAPPSLVAQVPLSPSRATPSRGSQAQVTDTLPPPPTTTTTTTPPPPPSWVLPANSGTGRRVVYSKSAQRVWTVEADGTVSKTHLVSGRLTWNQPLPGTYSVFSRSGYTCNIKSPWICWRYMVRFTKGPGGDNIGFHEIPVNTETGNPVQSIYQLGTALSAGCVRQATPDAQYMWRWAPIGTKVVVLG